jgi:hypothetical protein
MAVEYSTIQGQTTAAGVAENYAAHVRTLAQQAASFRQGLYGGMSQLQAISASAPARSAPAGAVADYANKLQWAQDQLQQGIRQAQRLAVRLRGEIDRLGPLQIAPEEKKQYYLTLQQALKGLEASLAAAMQMIAATQRPPRQSIPYQGTLPPPQGSRLPVQ